MLTREKHVKTFIKAFSIICLFALPVTQAISAGSISLTDPPWEAPLNWFLEMLTGSTGVMLAGLGLAGVGVMWLRGQWDVMKAIGVTVGIALLFGAPAIVDAIRNAVAVN